MSQQDQSLGNAVVLISRFQAMIPFDEYSFGHTGETWVCLRLSGVDS